MTELLTTAEVADRLNVHRSVVVKLVRAGRLTPCKTLPGKTGAHLFDPADVDAYLSARNERGAA